MQPMNTAVENSNQYWLCMVYEYEVYQETLYDGWLYLKIEYFNCFLKPSMYWENFMLIRFPNSNVSWLKVNPPIKPVFEA